MRDKFTELIELGVAKFEYAPTIQDKPEQDMICRTYNNIFSIPSDTHMSCLADGTRVITGHMIGTDKWEKFICACSWGAVDFKTSGYWSVCDFLHKHGFEGCIDKLNGDIIYRVQPKVDEFKRIELPSHYTTTESKIPQPIRLLTTNGDVNKIIECFKSDNTIESLNTSLYIKGSNWIEYNGKVMGLVGDKVIVIK